MAFDSLFRKSRIKRPIQSITRMNPKRILISIIVAFVAIFGTDYLIHQVWLKDTYAPGVGKLWRTAEDMKAYVPNIFVGEFMVAVAAAMLWARIALGGAGIQCAVGLGIFLGLFEAGIDSIQRGIYPLPDGLLTKWIIADFAQMILVGVVLFFVHKPTKSCPEIRGK